ncbi:MAG: nucleoside-diphosphate kinase [Candidatus Berkelbacteria bacterium]
MERTFVLIKPSNDRVEVIRYVMEVLGRAGFLCVYQEQMRLNDKQAAGLYADSKRESYHAKPIVFIQTAPVVAMIWEGEDAIRRVKELVGPTKVDEAMATDCIRGELLKRFGKAQPPFDTAANFVHVSATSEEFESQIRVVLPRKVWAQFVE